MIRQSQPLSQHTAKQLLTYAALAGATIAASTPPANAEVVYTPIHRTISIYFPLDLNNDGILDFFITTSYLSGLNELLVFPTGHNEIVAVKKACVRQSPGAAPLPHGATIGPSKDMESVTACMASLFDFSSEGPWINQTNRYLGFKFVIKGEFHYGWARLSVNSLAGANITGYAYETIPFKPIVAGDEGKAASVPNPGTLGSLAAGAPASNPSRNTDDK